MVLSYERKMKTTGFKHILYMHQAQLSDTFWFGTTEVLFHYCLSHLTCLFYTLYMSPKLSNQVIASL